MKTTKRTARTSLRTAILASLVWSAVGCATPRMHGAHAILPAQTTDTEEVWVYVDSENDGQDGVYRCTDTGPSAVCTKAELR